MKLLSTITGLFEFKLLGVLMLCSNINTMLVQKSNSISTIVPFSSSAINNLWHAGQELNGTSIAGVSTGNRDMLCLLLCCHMETRKL